MPCQGRKLAKHAIRVLVRQFYDVDSGGYCRGFLVPTSGYAKPENDLIFRPLRLAGKLRFLRLDTRLRHSDSTMSRLRGSVPGILQWSCPDTSACELQEHSRQPNGQRSRNLTLLFRSSSFYPITREYTGCISAQL